MAATNPAPRPALSLLTYLQLATAQVGSMQAEMDALVADIRTRESEYVVDTYPGLDATWNQSQGYGYPGGTPLYFGWRQLPPGGPWRTAIYFTMASVAMTPNGWYGAYDSFWQDDAGMSYFAQTGLACVPLFNPQHYRLLMGGSGSNYPIPGPMPVWFTRKQYYNGQPYYGY